MAIPKKKVDSKKKINYGDAKKRTEMHDSGYTPTTYRVPEGMKVFRFKKEGKYRLDVIPFIAKKSNPFAGGDGVVWYERTYYAHKDIGPDSSSYCCLNKTFNERCPICDHVAKMRRDPKSDEQAIKALSPKERQLWLFIDQNAPEDGIQLYEASFYMGFGQLIDSKVKSSDDEDGYDRFFQLEGGMTVKVLVEQDSFNGRQFFKPVTIDMVARTKDLDDSILDDAPCLDDLLIKVPYPELKKIFLQEDTDEAEEVDEEDEKVDENDDEGDDGDDDVDAEVDGDGDDDDSDDDEPDVKKAGRNSSKTGKGKGKQSFKVKDKVTFKKGKKMVEGVITKVNEKTEHALVKIEEAEIPVGVPYSELSIVAEEEDTDEWEDEDDSELETDDDEDVDADDSDLEEIEEDDWEDDDLEEEEPKPKAKKKK